MCTEKITKFVKNINVCAHENTGYIGHIRNNNVNLSKKKNEEKTSSAHNDTT